MASSSRRKMRLSNNLLKMKFMQRYLTEEAKQDLEQREKRIISDEHWYLDLPELAKNEALCVENVSFSTCEQLLFGRMSFHGFNPEVEQLCKRLNASQETTSEEEDDDNEKDISDAEMARRYQSVVETIGKKFQNKRQRSRHPDDDDGEEEEDDGAGGESRNKSRLGATKKKFLRPTD
uniref:M-phase phosphoprotein 6 n=1 Tax=Eptatretus burgeri TaxID=7764 RepID=A0A8C4PXD1_EPTBU